MPKPSLRSIAHAMGVSPSTVSRALRNSPRISESRKRQVREMLAVYGYPLDPAAGERTDERERSAVAFLIANPQGNLNSDSFFTEVIRGAVRFLKEAGRSLLVDTLAEGDLTRQLESLLASQRVSALVVGGIPLPDRCVETLANASVPAVFIGKYTQNPFRFNAVLPDNVEGGRLVGLHLTACGYEEFYYFGGDLHIHTFSDRLNGYQQGLKESGARLPAENVLISPRIDQAAGYRLAKMLLSRLTPGVPGQNPVRRAIFAATDWMAAGVLRALAEEGRAVPEEFGVVGYSDLELASHIIPALTTVRVNMDQLGYLAARTAVDLASLTLAGPIQIVQQPVLAIRESSAQSQGTGNVQAGA